MIHILNEKTRPLVEVSSLTEDDRFWITYDHQNDDTYCERIAVAYKAGYKRDNTFVLHLDEGRLSDSDPYKMLHRACHQLHHGLTPFFRDIQKLILPELIPNTQEGVAEAKKRGLDLDLVFGRPRIPLPPMLPSPQSRFLLPGVIQDKHNTYSAIIDLPYAYYKQVSGGFNDENYDKFLRVIEEGFAFYRCHSRDPGSEWVYTIAIDPEAKLTKEQARNHVAEPLTEAILRPTTAQVYEWILESFPNHKSLIEAANLGPF